MCPYCGQSEEAMRIVHARLPGDILEGAVTAVVIEVIARAFQSTRPTLHSHVVILASLLRSKGRQIVQVKIDVVCDKQVRPPIAVVVSEGSPGRPPVVAAQSGLF